METNIVYISAGIVALLIFVFVARRLLRLAMKLTLVGVVLLAVLAGAGYGWWNGWFASQPRTQHRGAPARTAAPR